MDIEQNELLGHQIQDDPGGVNNWNKPGVATYPSHPPEKKGFLPALPL
jgi:hypothetical protein